MQPLVFPCAHYILYSRIPRIRALLPANAGETFVNGPRKTNATFGVACFSFGLIISYTQVPRADALHCLLTQAIRSLMACEKQMSADAAACFSLRSLHHLINHSHNSCAKCIFFLFCILQRGSLYAEVEFDLWLCTGWTDAKPSATFELVIYNV